VKFKVFGITAAMLVFMIPQVIWLSGKSSLAIRGRAAMNRATRGERLRRRLVDEFQPLELSVETRAICMPATPGRRWSEPLSRPYRGRSFSRKPAVARHRMVYAAVGDLMTSEIHALAIDASPPPDYVQTPERALIFSQSRRIILNCRPRAHRPSWPKSLIA